MDIVILLQNQAQEIAKEGHNGWGNTMMCAASEIETLRKQKNELAAQLADIQRDALSSNDQVQHDSDCSIHTGYGICNCGVNMRSFNAYKLK